MEQPTQAVSRNDARQDKPTHFRWWVAALLFMAGLLNYLDRAALSVAAPFIKHDLHLDDASMGLIFSSFFIGYCLFCFVGGWAADRFGPRKVFVLAAGFWSAFCGATALAGTFTHLLIARVAFGVAEGPMGTTTNKSISNWFPRREAGRAVGITNAGQPLGAAVAAPIVGLVALQFGWRLSFVVIAILGFIWLVCWWFGFRDTPDAHRAVNAAEVALITSDRAPSPVLDAGGGVAPKPAHERTMWQYLLSLPVIGVALAFFAFNYVLYFFLTWLPSYLVDYQHLNVKQMSVVGMLPWLGAALGFILGGVLSDALYKRTGNVLFARKAVITLGLGVSAACVLFASQATTLTPAVALIATASLFAFMTPQACWSLLQDIVPAGRIGATGGFVHLLANLAGILSPSLTGWLVQYGAGYTSAFLLAGTLSAIGVVALLLTVRASYVARLKSVPVSAT